MSHNNWQSQSHNLIPMPPKQKDNSATGVSGSKAKCKKPTPTFRTPTTANPEATSIAASELNSTENQIVTLRASASGHCGYHTQDLTAATTSSNSDNASAPAAELPHLLPSNERDSIPYPTTGESNIDSQAESESGTKSRPKQDNTTTVSQHLIIAGISLTYNIDKTY
jgi:hypothetical protein